MAKRPPARQHNPLEIDLDELLHGSPTWEQVCWYFKNGEFYQEHYSIAAIERYLLTEEQRQWLFDNRISIEKCLNGRVAGQAATDKHKVLYKPWNEKLGFKRYGG